MLAVVVVLSTTVDLGPELEFAAMVGDVGLVDPVSGFEFVVTTVGTVGLVGVVITTTQGLAK